MYSAVGFKGQRWELEVHQHPKHFTEEQWNCVLWSDRTSLNTFGISVSGIRVPELTIQHQYLTNATTLDLTLGAEYSQNTTAMF